MFLDRLALLSGFSLNNVGTICDLFFPLFFCYYIVNSFSFKFINGFFFRQVNNYYIIDTYSKNSKILSLSSVKAFPTSFN